MQICILICFLGSARKMRFLGENARFGETTDSTIDIFIELDY